MADYNDCYGIYGPIVDDSDSEYYDHLQEMEMQKWWEQQQKEQRRSIYASAYRKDLSTEEMVRLRSKGYSLRRIARELQCSPNTVKNRLFHHDFAVEMGYQHI